MIIHSLHLENIHSLEGAHTVDFDSPALSSAGLFAITGPTGAGKSTLLDAICLALYNQVPRLGKISKDSLKLSGGILTRGKQQALAQVEYSCAKGRYRSSWSIRINRNGNMDDYHMEVVDVATEKVIDVKRSEVPDTNAALIGLDYEQFLRSVVLAQGDFARFLKAGEKERNELLEKITGGEIFRHLGIRCHEIHRTKKEQERQLKEQVALIHVWSPEEEAEKQAAQHALTDQRSKSQQSYELARQQANAWERFTQIERKVSELDGQLEQLKAKQPEIQELAKKLELHRLAQRLTPFREHLLYAQNQLEQSKEEATQLKAEKESLIKQNDSWQREMEALLGEKLLLEEKRWRETTQQRLQQWEELATKITEANAEAKSLSAFIQDLLLRFPAAKRATMEATFCRDEDGIVALRDAIEALTTRIAQSPFTGKSEEDTQQLKAELASLYQKGLQKNQIIQQLSELRIRAEATQQDLKTTEDKRTELTRRQKESTAVTEQLDAQIAALQKAQQQIEKAHWLEELRGHLEQGHPCPVCGATHHPGTSEAHFPDATAEALTAALQQKEAQQKINDTLNQENATLSARHELLQEEVQRLSKTIKEQDQQIEQMKAVPDAGEIQQQQEELERFIRNEEYKANLMMLERKQGDLTKVNHALTTLKTGQSSLISGNNPYSRLKLAYENGNALSGKLHAWEERSKRFQLQQQKNENAWNSAVQAAETAAISAGFTTAAEAWDALLEQATETAYGNTIQAWEKNWQEAQALQKDLLLEKEQLLPNLQGEKLEHWIAAETQAKQELAALNEQLGILQQQFTQNREQQERRAALETRLRSAEDELRKWARLHALIGSSDGSRFSRMVQKIQLQLLLALANVRLASLTGRYRFHHQLNNADETNALLPASAKKESIYMIDLYYGNQPRAVETLSGGETFLASLALALGLSDLASGQMEIGCLFIDEGFGSLDEETLDLALDTLERLQAESNKRIGIISHVPLLKQRIYTQIRIVPQPGGYSKVIMPGAPA